MIKIKFTEEQLMQFDPCSEGLEFARSLNFDFNKIYDTCEKGNWMIWLLRKSKTIDKLQTANLAIVCAEHVLSIFEKKYPNDNRPRKAIEAAQAWLLNPTEGTHRAAAAYAYADANDAAIEAEDVNDADAANAAYAAANATAYAVASVTNTAAYANAANAAAYAVNAVTYAAYAANDAVNDADYDDFIVNAVNDAVAYAATAANDAANARTAESKWQANKIRELIPNPFK